MNKEYLKKSALESAKIFSGLDFDKIHEISSLIKEKLKTNKVLICGNGGSEAQAAHFEGELVGRYNKERKPLPGICLSLSNANMTCIGNDYGFEKVFSRGVEAIGNDGDVLFAITTSGNSPNIIEAIKTAKEKNMKVVCLLGKNGGEALGISDLSYVVNSSITARIQEAHIFIIHSICEYLENENLHN